jgi:hypothetical protein
MTRLLRVAAVAVLVGGATAVLTACSGDPGPIVTESPSPTVVVTTPSASPTPSVTPEDELLEQIPENARGEDLISATNFVVFFLSAYPQILTGSQPELFDLLSDEGCIFCDNVEAQLRDSLGLNEAVRGGEVKSLQTIADGGLQDDGTWSVSFDMSVTDLERIDSAGDIVAVDPGGEGRTTVLLAYDGHWVVLGVGAERS